MTITFNTLKTMFELQNAMNSKIDHDWISKKREWHRAIWIECAELVAHHGYKWWKHETPDINQMKLEIVDIWHFGLSWLIQNNDDIICLYLTIDQHPRNQNERNFIGNVEIFVNAVLMSNAESNSFPIHDFIEMMYSCGMDFAELSRMYLGKNILNIFRQDHGYKTGEYRKIWYDNREDNEHLSEIMDSVDFSTDNIKDIINEQLITRYSMII